MAAEPNTPEWWLRTLHARLQARRSDIELVRGYYDGRHRLAFASQKFAETFGGLFGAFADNWCGMVVDASVERLGVQGFRVGETPKADDDAWRIWQENDCDSESKLAFTESHVTGDCVATAWFGDDDKAEITFEPADCAIVAVDPKNRRRRLAGVRFWLDDWGFEHAELFLPNRVHTWRSKTTRSAGSIVDPMRVHWVPATGIGGTVLDGTSSSMPNPLGVVPMVSLVNNPRLWNPREDCVAGSEIQAIIPLQDAVNKLIADLLVASEAGALPLRYATGYTPSVDPKTNEALPPPWARDGAKWAITQDAQGKFGSLAAADLGNFVKAIELLVQ
ncbi:MAG: phage portal protein, partial [Actinobacteria bacterium]|nr:phage portal protein [Actinomycetota bacterium]